VYTISFTAWDGCSYMFRKGSGELFRKFLGVLHRRSRRCGFGFHQRAWRRDCWSFRGLDWSLYICKFLPLKTECRTDFEIGELLILNSHVTHSSTKRTYIHQFENSEPWLWHPSICRCPDNFFWENASRKGESEKRKRDAACYVLQSEQIGDEQ
jgi:hypothetical protein